MQLELVQKLNYDIIAVVILTLYLRRLKKPLTNRLDKIHIESHLLTSQNE